MSRTYSGVYSDFPKNLEVQEPRLENYSVNLSGSSLQVYMSFFFCCGQLADH